MDESQIRTLDRISWINQHTGRRVFGYVMAVRHGTILAKTENGVFRTLRRGTVTKECG